MNKPFQFTEAVNSPDLTDEEVASAIPTSCADDITPHVEAPCGTCGKPWVKESHRKRFRFPHFYSRVILTCPDGHQEKKVFQATWLYQPPPG